MAGGRPTKLNKEVIEQTKAYIINCEDKEKEVNLPTIEGLAYEIKVNKTTIHEWRKGESEMHIEFHHLIEELLEKQARQLVNKGLAGTYNSTIAKVLLTKHGYREGIETKDVDAIDRKEIDEEVKKLAHQINELQRNNTPNGIGSNGVVSSAMGD